MIGHALLAVIAAREHSPRPTPDGLTALTCNELRRLFVSFVIEPGRSLACPWRGHAGGDATNTAPAPATSGAKGRHNRGHNDLRLEC
jgi:hypothetical protein